MLSGGQGGTGHGQLSSLGGCRRGGIHSPDSPVSHDPGQTTLGSEIRAAVEGGRPGGRLSAQPSPIAVDLPQHPDEYRPQRPILLAVDQQLGEEILKPALLRTEDANMRIEGTAREFIGEIAVWAVLCLVGGAFILLWGEHPVLLVTGIGLFAVVAGWLGYLYRGFMDPQSTRLRRIQAAFPAGALAGLCAFAVSLVFCSCE